MFKDLKKLNNGKIRIKVLATLLVITLTFANFSLLGSYVEKAFTSYATENELTFEASIVNEEGKFVDNISADINEENLQLYISINLPEGGQFKGGEIELQNTNFKFKADTTKNICKIGELNENLTASIPIVATKSEEFNLNLLDMESKIKLTGEYIAQNGEVTNIDLVKTLKINWTTENFIADDVLLSEEIITNKIYNINGEEKRVVQVLVKSNMLENKAPVEKTTIEIEDPQISAEPEQVKVMAYSTLATNGKTEIEFNDKTTSMWNKEEGKTKIEIFNNKDENNVVTWNKNCQDEFVITYIYAKDAQVAPFISNAVSTVKVFGKADPLVKENTLSLEEIDEIGNVTDFETLITPEIYKGNMYLNQDTEYEVKNVIKVSYIDIVNKIKLQDNGDVTNNENISTYYKTTEINKAQAISLLGEAGVITVYNAQDMETPLNTITLSEQEENIVITYPENISNIIIETTKPVKEGKLEITSKKVIAVTNTENLKEFTQMDYGTKLIVENLQQEEIVNLDKTVQAKILEPVTTINTVLDKENLSNQAVNELTLTTELVTDNNSNKLFKNPTIKITLPKELTVEELGKIELMNKEYLDIETSQIVTSEEGNQVIEIKLNGEQKAYKTGATKEYIVMNLKVKANPFIADKNVEVKTTVINDAETVEKVNNVNIISKEGFVTKNTLITPENTIEKINTNRIEANVVAGSEVEIKSSFINNFGENLSNISMVKNLPQGVALKSEVTTNLENASIEYLNENGEKQETFENARAFKVVVDGELENTALMEIGYKLGVNQDAEINTVIENKLAVNYTINEQAKTAEMVFALNIVKEGDTNIPEEPEEEIALTIVPKAMAETLHENQIVTYQINVTNNSSSDLNNVKLDYKIPEGATYTELTYAQGSDIVFTDNENITNKTWNIESLGVGRTCSLDITLRIKEGATQIINNISLTNAEGTEIAKLETAPVAVNKGELTVRLSRRDNLEIDLTEDDKIQYVVMVTNNTDSVINNLNIESKVPQDTTWITNKDINSDFETDYNKEWTYNSNENKITRKIETINPGETLEFRFEVEVNKLENSVSSAFIENTALITTEDNKEYSTNVFTSKVIVARWEIHLKAEHSEKINEEDIVKYIIEVTNIGTRSAIPEVEFKLPEELQFRELTYYVNADDKNSTGIIQNNDIVVDYVAVEPDQTLTIEIEGMAFDLPDDVPNKEITAIAKIDLGDGEYLESEKIVNTIVNDIQPDIEDPDIENPDPENPDIEDPDPENPDPENPDIEDPDTDPTTTNSISGLAWLDENKNGIRDNQEEVMQSIKVLLLDENGNIAQETVTSLTGTYKFSNLANGKYIVVFEYDTNKYYATKYQVENASEELNSDAISKEIELDNQKKIVGITDTIVIENSEISNIDIGLIENAKFDLSLEKLISKVVVTNSKGTKTYEFEDTNFTKVEILSKQFAGSNVLVEYEIKISNDSDVAGYATDIIDYLPKELSFSSEMNSNWYMASDNYLHYMPLEPEAIEAGKSKTVKLVLTKTLKADSAGTIENSAEILEAGTLEGLKDANSQNNKSQADLIISIQTGGPALYIGIVLSSMIILGTGIYLIYKKVLKENV